MLLVLLVALHPRSPRRRTYDGNVFVVTGGDNLNHEVQFRYNA